VGDQGDQRDEERIDQGGKSTACDSPSFHWRPASHNLLRRQRNGHKEQADERGSGTGARDEEVEEFWWNHEMNSFLKSCELEGCHPEYEPVLPL
jgi:hypothetical protein